MTEGNNPTDRSKRGQAKRHILTDKKGIPLSAIITSANEHNIKAVTVAIYNAVIELPAAVITFLSKTKTKRTIRR
jgi:putative transposase